MPTLKFRSGVPGSRPLIAPACIVTLEGFAPGESYDYVVDARSRRVEDRDGDELIVFDLVPADAGPMLDGRPCPGCGQALYGDACADPACEYSAGVDFGGADVPLATLARLI